MRLAHITIITALSTACSEPVVDLEGSVNGETVTGAAHWGGPHIVFTNSDMGCQEVDWVETSYGVSDTVALRTSESFAAMQITFRSSDVVEGETPITATSPPANSGSSRATMVKRSSRLLPVAASMSSSTVSGSSARWMSTSVHPARSRDRLRSRAAST